MKQLISISFFTLWFFWLDQNIYAAVTCQQDEAITICQGSEDLHQSTTISFKPIESWGGNAGMILVEICQQQSGREQTTECIRRYCTDVVEEFFFAIDGLYIPITPGFGIDLSFGFHEQSFSIQCETITPNRRGLAP